MNPVDSSDTEYMIRGRVTIVIPCFNDQPDHLHQSVQSAIGQSWPDLEVIVVDDGSTHPETTAALNQLPAQVILIRQRNAGVAAARNAGVSNGTGEYVQLLDCDDWLDPHYVAEAVEALAYPGAQIAQGMMMMFGNRARTRVPKEEQ